MNPQAPCSDVAGFDFFVRGRIVKFPFPQHPAKVFGFLPVDKIPDGERHGRAVFCVAGDLQQVVQVFFVQFNGDSHAPKMMQKTSSVNHKNIIRF
jgi:hypothetical protein